MRKLIATVFNYSLDGLIADEGTEFWKFCFDLPENREPDDAAQLDFLQSAYAHIMGRTAYESISRSMTRYGRFASGTSFASRRRQSAVSRPAVRASSCWRSARIGPRAATAFRPTTLGGATNAYGVAMTSGRWWRLKQ